MSNVNFSNMFGNKKETIGNMVERGFYTGVGAAVGLVVICATPEILAIAATATVATVCYKAVERVIENCKA